MNLHHLQSLVTLSEERHFVRAAERLGISQPSVVRKLRRHGLKVATRES